MDDPQIRWDNTVTVSTEYALHNALPAAANYCALGPHESLTHDRDGSCVYGAGFHTARVDLLSQVDIDAADFGLHASAAGWYDGIDNNDDGSKPGAYRAAEASEYGGHNLELFEAFIHGTVDLGRDQPLSFRLGRHSLAWGESLFFRNNGVAAGLTPVDTYMVQSPSDYHAKDVLLPVDQVSFAWAATGDLSIEAYYQFEWRRSRIDPNSAYIDPNNVLGAEGTSLIGLTVPRRGTFYYRRGGDVAPDSTDQYGLSLKWRRGDYDLGLYALSYDAKTPNIEYYPNFVPGPGAAVGAYDLEFPTGIEIYGASLAGPLGDAVFGAEISGRRNMPLVNGGLFIFPSALRRLSYDGGGQGFPVGDTLNGQFYWICTVPPVPVLPDGATWRGEIAANHLIGATGSAGQLSPGRTRTAAAFRTVFEPQFFQVLPRIDITVPVGIGWNFLGLSETDPAMNRGTGDIDFGVTATVDQAWKGAIAYTHYFGRSKFPPVGIGGPQQPLGDWDYIQVSVSRSF